MHPDQLHWLPVLFWIAVGATLVAALDLAFFSTRRRDFVLGWICTFVSATLLLAYHISDSYTGVGINEATWYHLRNGMEGLTWGQVVPVVNMVVVCLLGLAAAFYLTLRLFRRRKEPSTTKASLRYMAWLVAILASPAFVQCALIASTWFNRDTYRAQLNAKLVPAPNRMPNPATPPSVVYIYGESLEGTFLDEEAFPGLAPNLQRLRNKAFSVDGIKQAPFTGWTIAGIIASQCAFPALGNQDHRTNTPTRGMRCLGDILHDQGYELAYINGSSLAFTGKDQFFRAHHYDTMLGKEQLIKRLGDDVPHSQWGLYDDTLFAEAEKEFDRLNATNKPFLLSLLTVDTHPPKGHQTPGCSHLPRYKLDNPMLDAVHCTDFLVDGFIKRLQAKRPGNLIIVIGSDHLQAASASVASKYLTPWESRRHDLWIAMGQGVKPAQIKRTGTTFDVAPTLLSLMGFDVPAMHWGRDLARAAPTLPEAFGLYPFFDRVNASFAMGDDGAWRQDVPNPKDNPSNTKRDAP